MKIVTYAAAGLCLISLVAAPALAGGFEYAGIGAKARGMSGAFRAVADDWTAAYYNPAGYAYALDNQLGGAVGMFHLRDELNPDYRWGGTYETGIYNDLTNFNRHEVLSVPSAGFIVRLPVWGETVFGLSAYQSFDQNISWELFDPLPTYNDLVTPREDHFRNNLDVVVFQLTAAREFVEEQLAAGIGMQLLRGDLIYRSIIFRDNPLRTLPGADQDIWARPREKINALATSDGFGFGFGLSGGLLWTVNERVQVGATVRLPFDITIDGDAQVDYYMPDAFQLWNNGDSAAVSNPGTVGQLFLSGATVNMFSEFETKLKLPPSFGAGVAIRPTEKLTVALDAEYTLWSRFDGFKFSFRDHELPIGPADTSVLARAFFTSDLSFPVDWEDAFKAMVGVSYDAHERFTLLAGGKIDQSPAEETGQFTPLFVDTGTKYGVSGGVIVHIERWDLGLATTYLHQPDLTVAVPDEFGDGEDLVTFPGDYRADTYETILSFNYRF